MCENNLRGSLSHMSELLESEGARNISIFVTSRPRFEIGKARKSTEQAINTNPEDVQKYSTICIPGPLPLLERKELVSAEVNTNYHHGCRKGDVLITAALSLLSSVSSNQLSKYAYNSGHI